MLMAMGLSWGTTSILALLALLTSPAIRGSIYGIQKVFFWVGISAAGFVAPALMNWLSYSTVMLILSAIGAVGLVLVAFYVKDPKPGPEPIVQATATASAENKIASSGEMTSLYGVGFLSKFIEDGLITTFLPLFLLAQAVEGSDPVWGIGAAVALYTILYAFFQPLGGWWSDLWGKWRLLGVGNSLLLIGVVSWIVFPATWGLYAMVTLTGMGSGILAATAEARASMIVSQAAKGRGIGMWRFFRDLGSFIGPILVGTVLSFADSSIFLILTLVLICICLFDSVRIIFWRSYDCLLYTSPSPRD